MKSLSIITVTYNDELNLFKTLQSIRYQKNKNFEYIVIDGKSSDNTELLINNNRDIIDTYVSEKDHGIYDAMNKGIQLSKGNYLLFLNAGDILNDSYSIDTIYNEVIRENLDIGYFNIVLNKQGHIKVKYQPIAFKPNYLYYNNICHQSMVIRKSIYNEYGFYNAKNRIYADYEHLYKIIQSKKTIKIQGNSGIISQFDLSGISTKVSFLKSIVERWRVIHAYGNCIDKMKFIFFNLFFKPFHYIQRR